MAGEPFSFWLFVLLNYVVSALMYSLLARFIMAAFLDPDSRNYIFRFFIAITSPVVRVVAIVTPRAVPQPILVLFSAIWLLILRFVLFLTFAAVGFVPAAGS